MSIKMNTADQNSKEQKQRKTKCINHILIFFSVKSMERNI
jgi:hypothetical protein